MKLVWVLIAGLVFSSAVYDIVGTAGPQACDGRQASVKTEQPLLQRFLDYLYFWRVNRYQTALSGVSQSIDPCKPRRRATCSGCPRVDEW